MEDTTLRAELIQHLCVCVCVCVCVCDEQENEQ